MAAAMAGSAVSVSRAVGSTTNDNLVAFAPSKHERDEASNEEKQAVHDSEHPRRLEHSASLVGINVNSTSRRDRAKCSQVQAARAIPTCDLRAVCIRDTAQRIDTTDKRADEKNVDKADEAGVFLGAVVGEQSADGPDDGEDGDYEEDEDGVWGESVVLDVDVDEVGKHADRWDL